MSDKEIQALQEQLPSSVQRFRELGLMSKQQGEGNSQAAEKFMQLCFRSMAYGVHVFNTCLLLERDFGSEKRVDAVVHISRMGVMIFDNKSNEVLDRLAVNMIRRTGCMDDAWLIDTGDWRQPSIVVLESSEPKRLNACLNKYLGFLQEFSDHASTGSSFSEIFSGWVEEKAIIGYNRKFAVVFGDRLVFYDDETRSNVKDSIPSMDVTAVELVPQPVASTMQMASGMEKVPFKLSMPDNVRTLYAFSKAMGNLWVEAIESMIESSAKIQSSQRVSMFMKA